MNPITEAKTKLTQFNKFPSAAVIAAPQIYQKHQYRQNNDKNMNNFE